MSGSSTGGIRSADGMERSLNRMCPCACAASSKMQFLLPSLPAAFDKIYAEGGRTCRKRSIRRPLHPGLSGGAPSTFGDLNNPRTPFTKLAQPDVAHEGQSRNPKAFRLLERAGHQYEGLLPVQQGMGSQSGETPRSRRPDRESPSARMRIQLNR